MADSASNHPFVERWADLPEALDVESQSAILVDADTAGPDVHSNPLRDGNLGRRTQVRRALPTAQREYLHRPYSLPRRASPEIAWSGGLVVVADPDQSQSAEADPMPVLRAASRLGAYIDGGWW
ncbi:hypothetical protein KC354_g80 [Hortaea werneckii]|nr:hypothetical protein KC354_g80 [Hortaea werneckii]